jgi:hypothetical protein
MAFGGLWIMVILGWLDCGCTHFSSREFIGEVRRVPTTVTLRHLDYQFAVSLDERGVPKMNWQLYRSRPERVVESRVPAVVLETRWFRATLIPQMGRLHSFVDRRSGREQLWINPIAIPLGAHNDTGFWMTWGGVEHVMPSGEHGTSHALSWEWDLVELEGGWIGVEMVSIEPLTGLRHQIMYLANAKERFLETRIAISNQGENAVAFSHWTTATLSPGGKGEVTAKTEIIVPADEFVPDDRDFNQWMVNKVGDTRTAPIRFVGEWEDIGDLMTSPLRKGYYAVFAHEVGDGLIRSFPLKSTPGFDIWGWGYPASEQRQKEFTRVFPSQGYIEFWNGNVHGFKDDALAELAAGASLQWAERLVSVHVDGSNQTVRRQIKALADTLSTVSRNE